MNQILKSLSSFKVVLMLTLLFAGLIGKAQTTEPEGTSLTFFTQDGQPFFLIIDGVKQNSKAETSVKVSGLKGVSVMAKFIFKDESLKPHDERFSLTGVDPGYYDITYAIRWNEKKKRWYTRLINWINKSGTNNNSDNNSTGSNNGAGNTEQPNQGGNTQVIIQNPQVDVTVSDGQGNTTTIKSPSSGTSTKGGVAQSKPRNPVEGNVNPSKETAQTPAGNKCVNPMAPNTFQAALASLKSASFESSRLEQAKVMAKRNCLSIDQVKQVIATFGFEESKLDYAKAAYPRCTDKANYYLVNDQFAFSSSRDDLNEFISNAGE